MLPKCQFSMVHKYLFNGLLGCGAEQAVYQQYSEGSKKWRSTGKPFIALVGHRHLLLHRQAIGIIHYAGRSYTSVIAYVGYGYSLLHR